MTLVAAFRASFIHIIIIAYFFCTVHTKKSYEVFMKQKKKFECTIEYACCENIIYDPKYSSILFFNVSQAIVKVINIHRHSNEIGNS